MDEALSIFVEAEVIPPISLFVGRVALHLPLSVANGVQPGFFQCNTKPASLAEALTNEFKDKSIVS